MRFHKDHILMPEDPNTIWVFGSNLAGRHGGGAALVAAQHYEAEYGVGVGFTGRCYAIPTKDQYIRTMSLEAIEVHIRKFNDLSHAFAYDYFITRVGCGLAGYTDDQIAPLFYGANWKHCCFPEQWEQYLK